jgi:hypothetical protein
MRWGGWQEQHLDDVFVIKRYMISTLEKSRDCGKMFTMEANCFKIFTWIMPNKSHEKHVIVEKCSCWRPGVLKISREIHGI